jgi:hypothetical protein
LTTSQHPSTIQALLAALDDQQRLDVAAYAAGYRDGYESGWQVGYGHAHHEMAAAWKAVAEQVRALADRRTNVERAALDAAAVRGEPCRAACGRCSLCARAAAVTRNGGDYPGRAIARGAA